MHGQKAYECVKFAAPMAPNQGVGGVRTPDGSGAPRIQLRGYSIGPQTRFPQHIGQDVYSVRDDLTYSFNKGGRHDLKTGAEYMKYLAWLHWCSYLNPQLFADNAPIPANIEQLFPVWNDPSTWNIAALSPITRQYRFHVGTCTIHNPRHIFAGWVQDDWAITPRLTLNLGVRYDMESEIFAHSVAVPPFLEANRPNDTELMEMSCHEGERSVELMLRSRSTEKTGKEKR